LTVAVLQACRPSFSLPQSTLLSLDRINVINEMPWRETENGSPLTEQQVLEIGDTAPAVAVPAEGFAAIAVRRG
jgi:hypothetical protein